MSYTKLINISASCPHDNVILLGVTTGKCVTFQEHECTNYCYQPPKIEQYLCKRCSVYVYGENNIAMNAQITTREDALKEIEADPTRKYFLHL